MWDGLANVSGDTSALTVQSCLKMQAEHVMQSKPIDISAVPICFLCQHNVLYPVTVHTMNQDIPRQVLV